MREATIQRILSVEPIENADKLEKATVLGWQTVVEKGEFKPGDLCVYCEIDSVLPDKPSFEFLRSRNFRIKTIKLRGVLSQGIVFPLSIIGGDPSGYFSVGDDVSELIGVTHYEKPLSEATRGFIRCRRPSYVPQTDEPRIQSVLGVLDELRGIPCVSTIKINGTSASYTFRDGDFHVCSRDNSFELIPENDKLVYYMMEKKYEIAEKLRSLGINIAVQGEIAGPRIQKNRLGLKEVELFVFNVFKIDSQKYLDHDEVKDFCRILDLKMIPEDKRFIFNHTLEQLLEMANRKYEGTDNRREGIVVRPEREMFSETIRGRMSFKVASNKYLLEVGE